jgi:phosphonate transport system substrate-binding protein
MSFLNLRRAAGLLAVVLVSFSAQAAPRTVSLGLSEGKIAGAALREHAALIKHLNSRADFAVEVKVFPSHGALYEAFKAKKVDFAALGPVMYVQARFETGAVPLAAEGTRAQSVIFVRKDSPIRSVKELKGKRFAFGYEDSTSTYLMPLLVLSKSHIKEKDLGKTVFIGSQQDKIVDAVVKKEVDAGAVANQLFEQLAANGAVRALELSEPFPGPPVVAQKTLDAATAERFKQMLLTFKPAPSEKTQRFGKGVHVVTDADYNKVRFLCKVILKKSYVK